MIINKMTILFSQLKNFIQNDPLSDWFEKIHPRVKPTAIPPHPGYHL